MADSFVFAGANPDEFWVGSYFSHGVVIRERLESHIIADEVTIEDHTERWTAVSIFGSAARATLESAQAPDVGFVFVGRRTRDEHAEFVFPADAESIVRERCGELPELGPSEVALRRVESGIPAVPFDLGPGDLPNEGGLDAVAISYTKGCYLGQEIMARLKSMGQVRRRLVRVSGSTRMPQAWPAPVFAAGRQVGELRSAAERADGTIVGLALVSTLHLAPGAPLAFAVDAAPALAVLDPP